MDDFSLDPWNVCSVYVYFMIIVEELCAVHSSEIRGSVSFQESFYIVGMTTAKSISWIQTKRSSTLSFFLFFCMLNTLACSRYIYSTSITNNIAKINIRQFYTKQTPTPFLWLFFKKRFASLNIYFQLYLFTHLIFI